LSSSINKTLYKTILLIVVVVPFLATLVAVKMLWDRAVHPSDLILLAVMYSFVALGVTVGFHRMLTHRGFKPNPVVKFIFLVLGSMSLEGPAVEWAATHTKHHAESDKEDDPHSPTAGFFHAHVGWLFKDRQADPKVYAKHLLNDKMVMFVSNTFLMWVALSFAIPFFIGGLASGHWNTNLALSGMFWAGLVRVFLNHHVTWSVNSVCHTFGKRDYETPDQSRNEWVVGLLAFGEGWHNNHHAFPRSAFHGLKWYQFDLSGYIIWTLERVGLIKDVYRIPTKLRDRYNQPKVSPVIPEVVGSPVLQLSGKEA